MIMFAFKLSVKKLGYGLPSTFKNHKGIDITKKGILDSFAIKYGLVHFITLLRPNGRVHST